MGALFSEFMTALQFDGLYSLTHIPTAIAGGLVIIPLIMLAFALVGLVVIGITIPIIPFALGTLAGPVAGSIAAMWQSAIGAAVVAGSPFAIAQAVGMGASVPAVVLTIKGWRLVSGLSVPPRFSASQAFRAADMWVRTEVDVTALIQNSSRRDLTGSHCNELEPDALLAVKVEWLNQRYIPSG
ncbi:hypothetical protein BDV98DRAFT_621141 [Pterulicium gracile]|uniref:Uncharacterized protein n=1 Tax=Pterulicium gracile TaxID=1884261 RepID=A0A5C3QHV8_9AGAR|nr:hypothetical protein BDV98DRAFT_621141 [Pterula gracilis]